MMTNDAESNRTNEGIIFLGDLIYWSGRSLRSLLLLLRRALVGPMIWRRVSKGGAEGGPELARDGRRRMDVHIDYNGRHRGGGKMPESAWMMGQAM